MNEEQLAEENHTLREKLKQKADLANQMTAVEEVLKVMHNLVVKTEKDIGFKLIGHITAIRMIVLAMENQQANDVLEDLEDYVKELCGMRRGNA